MCVCGFQPRNLSTASCGRKGRWGVDRREGDVKATLRIEEFCRVWVLRCQYYRWIDS